MTSQRSEDARQVYLVVAADAKRVRGFLSLEIFCTLYRLFGCKSSKKLSYKDTKGNKIHIFATFLVEIFGGTENLPYLCTRKSPQGLSEGGDSSKAGPFVYRLGREIFIL